MRLATTLALCLTLALPASAEAPKPRGRGWLTGASVVLLAAAGGLAGVGLAAQLDGDRARAVYAPYAADPRAPDAEVIRALNGGALNGEPVPGLIQLADRTRTACFIGAGAALVAGLTGLVLDGLMGTGPLTVGVGLTPAGAAAFARLTW